jgi:hypothetical protein
MCSNIWGPEIVPYICVLALYVAWLRNYMHSSTVNIVTKDVDFYRCMCDSWLSCMTSSGCRLVSLIIGGLITLTVHLCNCIWKFSEAFIL